MDTTYVYTPIEKAERNADGDLVVVGKATGPDMDSDQQMMDPGWLEKAMPKWFSTGANLREQHTHVAAGVATEMEKRDDGWWITGTVVDANTAKKVEKGVLKGFSIGVKGYQLQKDATARNGRVVGGTINEISLVDRPALATCVFTMAKAADAGVQVTPDDFDEPTGLVKVEELHEDGDLAKRDVPTSERRQAASDGQAMSDGSFPIKSESDLKNAITAVGRASNPAAAKSHIRKRAAALGASNLIPDSWKAADVDLEKLAATVDTLTEHVGVLAKSAGVDLTKSTTETPAPSEKGADDRTADLVKAAVAEAVKPFEETVAGLKGDLAKALEQPAPGGPVLTRTAQDTAASARHDSLLQKAATYRERADQLQDPNAKQGYLAMAEQLEATARV